MLLSDARQPEADFFYSWAMFFAKVFVQIVCVRVKKHGKTNVVTSRHIERQKALLPVEVRRSRMSLLKLGAIIL